MATMTAAISLTWFDCLPPGTFRALFSGCSSLIHTLLLHSALCFPLFIHALLVYTLISICFLYV